MTISLPGNHSRHDIASHIFGSTTSNAPGLLSARHLEGDFSSPLALIAFAIAFVDPAPAFGIFVMYVVSKDLDVSVCRLQDRSSKLEDGSKFKRSYRRVSIRVKRVSDKDHLYIRK